MFQSEDLLRLTLMESHILNPKFNINSIRFLPPNSFKQYLYPQSLRLHLLPFLRTLLKEESMLSRDTSKEVNTKDTNGRIWGTVLVFSTIKMEECMKVNGDSIECKARESFTINQESLPTKEIGWTISFKALASCITNIQKWAINP